MARVLMDAELTAAGQTAAELDLRRRGAFDDPGAQPGMLGQVLERAD